MRSAQERSQDLRLEGVALLLVTCSDSNLWLYCLTANSFLFMFFMCASRYEQNYFGLKFVKGPGSLFFVKLVN